MLKGINHTIILALSLVSQNALSEDLLFSCKTSKNKIVQLTKMDETIIYQYGKKESLELKLCRSRSDINIQLGQGSPGSFYDVISFFNGDYEYSINASSKINSLESLLPSGIDVFHKNKKIAEIKCITETVINNMENIEQ